MYIPILSNKYIPIQYAAIAPNKDPNRANKAILKILSLSDAIIGIIKTSWGKGKIIDSKKQSMNIKG